MDGFVSKQMIDNYKKLCKTYNVDLNEQVVRQLKNVDGGSFLLDLTACNFCARSCLVLAKFLTNDTHFNELKMTDCMLPEEGLKDLLSGLSKNLKLHTLDLKGNNIRGAGAVAVGQFIKHNHYLKRLLLEWNVIGSSAEAVKTLTEGLATNPSLLELDLRNNQVTHTGAAEIAASLLSNTTLQKLDLRWNNIGLLGGRAFLEALKTNRVLRKLELAGNNIHVDIMKATETAIQNNAERHLVVEEHLQREQLLTHGLRQMQDVAQHQLGDLISQMEKQQDDFVQTHRVSSTKIGRLQEALEERKSAFKSLEARLEMLQTSLALAEQQKREMNDQVISFKQEMESLRQQHLNILHQSREENGEREQVLLTDLRSGREQIKKLEGQVSEQGQTIELLQRKLTGAQEEIAQLQLSLKSKMEEAYNRLAELQRYHEQSKEITTKWHEAEALNQSSRIELQDLRAQLAAAQTQKQTLQNEVTAASLQYASERAESEKRLQHAQATTSELEKSVLSWTTINKELVAKTESLQMELESQRKMHAQMAQIIETKEELSRELSQTRNTLREKQKALDDEIDSGKRLSAKVKGLEREFQEHSKLCETKLKQKEAEISCLVEKIRLKEEHWRQLSEKEAQKVEMLRSAIGAYLH